MVRHIAPLLVVFLLVSCSSEKDSNGEKQRPAIVDKDGLPTSLSVVYQDKNAEQWWKELQDPDFNTSYLAASGLNKTGVEGLRFFRIGLNSGSEQIRYASVSCFPFAVAGPHKDVFLPILLGLLKDSSFSVRNEAGRMLLHSSFKEALPAMREALRVEKNEDTKKSMREHIKQLEEKK
jgi:hypothetical protein